MKKLIITGAQGTGKSAFVENLSAGKKTITIRPGDDQTSFFSRVQNENFDFVILEEANSFDADFVNLLLFRDYVLAQNEDATLIAIFQGIPIWAWGFPIYKMECRSYINQPLVNTDKAIKEQCVSFIEEMLLNNKFMPGRDYDIINSQKVTIKKDTGREAVTIDGNYILYIRNFKLSIFDKIPRIGFASCHRFKWTDKETLEDKSRISAAYAFDFEQLVSLSELNLNINDIIQKK